MKKIEFKSMILGFIIGTLTITSVSATTISIKTAKYNDTKIIYNGNELNLSQPIITVINEGSQYGSNYMPIRYVLENMGYNVEWDGKNNAVLINEVIENGGENTMEQNEINTTHNNILDTYSNFLSNFEFEVIEFDNIYTWKLYYNGNLTIDELKTQLSKDDTEATIKSLFTDIMNNTNGCMLFVYYDKQFRNVLISAEYVKEGNKITYNFSGIK